MPGVAKCGTTTLYDLLVAHPRVTGGIDKEVRFLMDIDDRLCPPVNVHISGLEAWASQYPDKGLGDFDIWLDASPQYQYQRTALETIARLEPQPKVLFILRNPARRLFSLYQYARYHQQAIPWVMSFEHFIEAVREPVDDRIAQFNMLRSAWRDTIYDAMIEDWSGAVPAHNLFVTSIEELAQDRTKTLRSLASWLNIDAQPLIMAQSAKSNPTIVTRSRTLRSIGAKAARLLPENPVVRWAKDAVRELNSAPVDRDELDDNAPFLAQLEEEFAPMMARLGALRASLAQGGDTSAAGAIA
ncbi:MAG: sulfotransferase domain-containing protein [Pseudomonadota bacterium]